MQNRYPLNLIFVRLMSFHYAYDTKHQLNKVSVRNLIKQELENDLITMHTSLAFSDELKIRSHKIGIALRHFY